MYNVDRLFIFTAENESFIFLNFLINFIFASENDINSLQIFILHWLQSCILV